MAEAEAPFTEKAQTSPPASELARIRTEAKTAAPPSDAGHSTASQEAAKPNLQAVEFTPPEILKGHPESRRRQGSSSRSPKKARPSSKGSASEQPADTASPHPLRLDSVLPTWFNRLSEASIPSTPKSVSMSSMRQLDSMTASLHSSAGPLSEADVEVDVSPILQGPVEMGLQNISASNLVMPSIQMPSRRAFTDRGRHLGSLKVLLTGPERSGKTSFLRALAQSDEDIVHIETASNSAKPTSPTRKAPQLASSRPIEYLASTKPFPSWWSESSGEHASKRRKTSTGEDLVLDRNLHFVEASIQDLKTNQICEKALEQTLHSQRSSDAVSLKLLSNDTGSLVDLVCYVTDYEPSEDQEELLQSLSRVANLVILIARADKRSPEESEAIKTRWRESLLDHSNSHPMSPMPPSASFELHSSPYPVFSISSAPSCTLESMDASLLMSSHPSLADPLLTPSDLPLFISTYLTPTSASYLRHSTAQKFISWRRRAFSPASPQHNLLTFNEYRQNEERESKLRLSAWRDALRARNKREREAYSKLARQERVQWLLERLNDCTRDGTMFEPRSQQHLSESDRRMKAGRAPSFGAGKRGFGNGDDNWWQVRSGIIILQLIGSVAVVGGAAIWLARLGGWEGALFSW